MPQYNWGDTYIRMSNGTRDQKDVVGYIIRRVRENFGGTAIIPVVGTRIIGQYAQGVVIVIFIIE